MNKKIIIINGAPCSGKDTFVSLFSKHFKTMNWSTIDPIKAIALSCGWNGEKTPEARKLLSDLKRILNEFNDFSYKETKAAIQKFNESDCDYLFIHIREPEEIKRIQTDFNADTLFVSRDEAEGNAFSNESDKNVHCFTYNYCVKNNGTLNDLERMAIRFGDRLKAYPAPNDNDTTIIVSA